MSRSATHGNEALRVSSRLPRLFPAIRALARAGRAAVAPAFLAGLVLTLLLAACQPRFPGAGFPETSAPEEAPAAPLSLEGARLPGPVTLLACGDVLLSRTVADMIVRNGYRWPFRHVRDLVSSADLAFCNLENPASFLGSPYPGKPAEVTFRAPPGALFGLAWAGFDVVSLANNHMGDYGPEAIRETLEYLDLLGIARAGAGIDEESARAPVIMDVRGARVAFLARAEASWSVVSATPSRPGIALADRDLLASDIAALRRQYRPDYVVVSVHWGEEHDRFPGPAQREFGRAAVDAGADLVLGHHPHVLQSLERYGEGLIVYSLGNFVFDMNADTTYDTAALRITLDGGRVRDARIIPMRIERRDYAPRFASPEEAGRILAGLRESSRLTGTAVEVADGRGRVVF